MSFQVGQTAQLETTAQSAILMDANGTILYEKDAHKPLPPASVTKIMTLLLGVEAVEQGRIALEDRVMTSQNAWKQGGSQIWLEPGETMSVKELLTAIAVVSANDAALSLMEHIYGSEAQAIEAMNEKAKQLGLANTHYSNVNGLPIANHYMSAYDTAQIVKEAVKHPLYLELCSIKESWLRDGKNWLVNTNKLLWWYPGADGLKTGWTQEAKYCFAGTAKRDHLRLIAVVYATPEPRSHLREAMKLMDYGFANFIASPVVQQGEAVERVKVNKGQVTDVQLLAERDLNVLVPKGQDKQIQKKIVVEENVTAPIIQGQKLGELIVLKDGKELERVNLLADASIEKAGFTQFLQDLMTRLFSFS